MFQKAGCAGALPENECIRDHKLEGPRPWPLLLATVFEPLVDDAGGEAQEPVQARRLGEAGGGIPFKPEYGGAGNGFAHVWKRPPSEQTT